MLNCADMKQRFFHAIKNGEFCVWYQPQVDMRSGIPRGAEALVRWKRADGGFVEPIRRLARLRHAGLRRGGLHLQQADLALPPWRSSPPHSGRSDRGTLTKVTTVAVCGHHGRRMWQSFVPHSSSPFHLPSPSCAIRSSPRVPFLFPFSVFLLYIMCALFPAPCLVKGC